VYAGLLLVHSWLRWVVLILAAIAAVRALAGSRCVANLNPIVGPEIGQRRLDVDGFTGRVAPHLQHATDQVRGNLAALVLADAAPLQHGLLDRVPLGAFRDVHRDRSGGVLDWLLVDPPATAPA